jgi:hypothetical protein
MSGGSLYEALRGAVAHRVHTRRMRGCVPTRGNFCRTFFEGDPLRRWTRALLVHTFLTTRYVAEEQMKQEAFHSPDHSHSVEHFKSLGHNTLLDTTVPSSISCPLLGHY